MIQFASRFAWQGLQSNLATGVKERPVVLELETLAIFQVICWPQRTEARMYCYIWNVVKLEQSNGSRYRIGYLGSSRVWTFGQPEVLGRSRRQARKSLSRPESYDTKINQEWKWKKVILPSKEGTAANWRSGSEGHRFETRCQQGLFVLKHALKCTHPLVICKHNYNSFARSIGWLNISFTCDRCDMSSKNKKDPLAGDFDRTFTHSETDSFCPYHELGHWPKLAVAATIMYS